jgi:hypothetical protein
MVFGARTSEDAAALFGDIKTCFRSAAAAIEGLRAARIGHASYDRLSRAGW